MEQFTAIFRPFRVGLKPSSPAALPLHRGDLTAADDGVFFCEVEQCVNLKFRM